jgi:hypothetical protein
LLRLMLLLSSGLVPGTKERPLRFYGPGWRIQTFGSR